MRLSGVVVCAPRISTRGFQASSSWSSPGRQSENSVKDGKETAVCPSEQFTHLMCTSAQYLRPGLRGSVYSRRRRATVTGTRRVLSAESSAVSIRIAKATTAAVAAAIYKALEKPVAKLVRAAAITIALKASGR